mgnify:CR=1 FL=1
MPTATKYRAKLTAPIKEGAPYDVFVSADMKFPQAIEHYGKAVTTPKVYAYGKLVLWSMEEPPRLNGLTQPHIKHIALANPELAPFGEAARLFLEYNSLDSVLKPKLVFAESVAQVNQFVTTKSVEIGFTSLSSALKHQDNDFYWMELKGRDQYLIEQVAVQLKQSDNLQLAERFFGYLKQFFCFWSNFTNSKSICMIAIKTIFNSTTINRNNVTFL